MLITFSLSTRMARSTRVCAGGSRSRAGVARSRAISARLRCERAGALDHELEDVGLGGDLGEAGELLCSLEAVEAHLPRGQGGEAWAGQKGRWHAAARTETRRWSGGGGGPRAPGGGRPRAPPAPPPPAGGGGVTMHAEASSLSTASYGRRAGFASLFGQFSTKSRRCSASISSKTCRGRRDRTHNSTRSSA